MVQQLETVGPIASVELWHGHVSAWEGGEAAGDVDGGVARSALGGD